MRIGFDAKRLFNNFTGLGNYSRFVVEALSRTYPENEYWLYTPKARQHADVDALLQLPNVKTQLPPAVVAPLKLGSFWRSMRIAKHAHRNDVQLFHGLSNELPLSIPKDLKTVVTIHDLIVKRYPQFYNPVDVRIYSWKLHEACQSADKIIAISQQTKDDIVEYLNIDHQKIEVIYQGCHPIFRKEYSADEIARVKEKYQLPEEFILNVGTIETRKNALSIVKAIVAANIKLPLVIVGKATLYKEQIEEYCKTHQLQNQIRFIHVIKFSDLPSIYRTAKVFVYPSLFEGFGIPIVEAIASGVPVISSTGSCFSEAGGPDCLYVDPTDFKQLGHAIQKVLSNPDQSRIMSERSFQYIQRFEPKVIATDLMRVYRELV